MEEVLIPVSDTYLYLYGVVRPMALDLAEITGIEEATVLSLLHCDELACVVSPVCGAEYTIQESSDDRQRADWIANRALRHDEILRRIHSLTTVVPFKFGTLCAGQDHLQGIMTQHREKFAGLLDLFAEREEWVIRLAWEREAVLARIQATNPLLSSLKTVDNQRSPGEEYFLAKKTRKITEGLAFDESASISSATIARLSSLAVELAPIACKKAMAGTQENIFAAALLLDQKGLSLVLEQLQQIEQDYSSYRITSELTGPWPPYSFVSVLA